MNDELDYYNDWLDKTRNKISIRPKSFGVYEAEIIGAKFSFVDKVDAKGRKAVKKKVTRKHSATGSNKIEATINLFREIRLFDSCETPHGNFNTPYFTIRKDEPS